MQQDILVASLEENLLASNGKEFVKNKEVEFLEDDVAGKHVKVPAGGYIRLTEAEMAVGSDDFTMDCWVFYTGGECSVSTMKLRSQYGLAMMLSYTAAYVGIGMYSYATLPYSKCPLNIWCHYALVRKDGVFYNFLNGELQSTVPAAYVIASDALVLNALYSDSPPGYVSGAANCYKNFRLSNYARWTDNFTPPDPKLPIQSSFSVVEKYEFEDGTPVKADEVKAALKDADFSTSAPFLDGYECIGYRLDNNGMQTGTDVIIQSVDANHTLVFVYRTSAPSPEPEDVNLHILLEVNESVDLTGYIHPIAPNVPQLVWSSEDAAIASVDVNGKVLGNKVGITKIFVKTLDDSWSAFIRVIVEPEGVGDLRLSILLEPGENCRLKALFMPDGTDKPIVWSSSDSAVADVNSNGKVTAVAEGEAIIFVQTTDGSFQDFIYVTVIIL